MATLDAVSFHGLLSLALLYLWANIECVATRTRILRRAWFACSVMLDIRYAAELRSCKRKMNANTLQMMPHQSQGACMAIEDAAALGILFNKKYFNGDISESLAVYNTVRLPRATRVQAAAAKAAYNINERIGT